MPARAFSTVVAFAAALASTLVAARARAAGFELVEQGPEAVATAGAQTADAYAAAAVYYNPAALTFQSGTTVQGGANLVLYRGSASWAGDGVADSSGFYATPAVFGGVRISPHYAVGIGVFDPFAWSIAYPAGWAGRLNGLSLELRALAINPSVAIRPWRWLAIGFGVDIVPTTLSYRRNVDLPGAEGELDVDVGGTGVGGNASILVRVVPRWLDVAIAYRSALDLDMQSSAAKTTLPLPHALSFAVASRPLTGLTLTTDVRLTLWSDVRSFSFTFSDMTMPKETVTLDYADTVGVRVGAAYRFWRARDGEPRLAVRIGGGWDQSPTSPATTSPLLPDGDRFLAGGGVGARFVLPRAVVLAVDAGYLATIAPESLGATSGNFVARYHAVTHTVSVALTLRLPNFPSRLNDPAFAQ